jgi:hypothetical protein
MRRAIGRAPGRLRTEREQRARQAAEEIGLRTCCGKGEADGARGLDDSGGDFQEAKSQRRELGGGQFPGFGGCGVLGNRCQSVHERQGKTGDSPANNSSSAYF